ncbi:helix-turn-helix transcriptional regulator [Nocardiopsis coralliicola]
MTLQEDRNRRLLRARDAMDRAFDRPLDVPAAARVALMSPAHFARSFRAAFGESPHRYLQRRRIERAMALLRDTELPVIEVALAVGSDSIGTFGRTFRAVVGDTPTGYRSARAGTRRAPECFVRAWGRPSSFGEARRSPAA